MLKVERRDIYVIIIYFEYIKSAFSFNNFFFNYENGVGDVLICGKGRKSLLLYIIGFFVSGNSFF